MVASSELLDGVLDIGYGYFCHDFGVRLRRRLALRICVAVLRGCAGDSYYSRNERAVSRDFGTATSFNDMNGTRALCNTAGQLGSGRPGICHDLSRPLFLCDPACLTHSSRRCEHAAYHTRICIYLHPHQQAQLCHEPLIRVAVTAFHCYSSTPSSAYSRKIKPDDK